MTKILVGGSAFALFLLVVSPWLRLRLVTLGLACHGLRWSVFAGVLAAGLAYFWPYDLPAEVETQVAWLHSELRQAAPELVGEFEGRAVWLVIAGLLVLGSWPILALMESGYQVCRWTWLTGRLNRLATKSYRAASADLKRRQEGIPANVPSHEMSELEKTAALLGGTQNQHEGNGEPLRLRDLMH